MIDYGHGIALGPISDVPPICMLEWRNNPVIYRWCRQHTPLEHWEHENWLSSLSIRQDVKMFGILRPADKRETTERLQVLGNPCVGVCGLTDIDLINGHAEFSLYIDPKCQGRGLGRAALKTLIEYGFDVLRLNHIFGETFEGNPACKMFEGVGFKLEGTRRKFYFREGEYLDAHLYSILSTEF